MELKDKVCLVTGASSGIGFEIAQYLIDQEAKLMITGRREDRLASLASDKVKFVSGDLKSNSFCDGLIEDTISGFGRIDVLVNCAGMMVVGKADDMDIEAMCDMIHLNIESTFRLTYKALQYMTKQNTGHIVNISSIMGTKVRPTAGPYAATKYAMEALSEALRIELTGKDIKVSCIQPGLVMTELHREWEVHPSESLDIAKPLDPADVVNAVAYVLSQPKHVRVPKMLVIPEDHAI